MALPSPPTGIEATVSESSDRPLVAGVLSTDESLTQSHQVTLGRSLSGSVAGASLPVPGFTVLSAFGRDRAHSAPVPRCVGSPYLQAEELASETQPLDPHDTRDRGDARHSQYGLEEEYLLTDVAATVVGAGGDARLEVRELSPAAGESFDCDVAGPIGGIVPSSEENRPVLRQSRVSASLSSLVAAKKSAVQLSGRFSNVANHNVGDVPFCAFTAFLALLVAFAITTNVFLLVTDARSRADDRGFPAIVLVLNYTWYIVQGILLLDLSMAYYRFFRPRDGDEEREKFLGSDFSQPRCWAYVTRLLGIELAPRGYLMLLAVILPVNTLLFYPGLGSPLYTRSVLDSSIADALQHTSVVSSSGIFDGKLGWAVNISKTSVVTITNTECYRYQSSEFRILSLLTNERIPKQAYCESVIGTMLSNWRKERSTAVWQHDEDIWEEAFQFVIRLFGSLVGIVADQTQDVTNTWFLRDMTDVFDMYMMAFVDVDQMHEGRPLLEGSHGLFGSYVLRQSYHVLLGSWLWLAYGTVILRALSILGWKPAVTLIKHCGSTADPNELRVVVDATLALMFIELPFLCLRWIAWYRYGVPVSVMGVKNVFGIFEVLHVLGVIRGFSVEEDGSKPKGLQLCLCCRRFQHEERDTE